MLSARHEVARVAATGVKTSIGGLDDCHMPVGGIVGSIRKNSVWKREVYKRCRNAKHTEVDFDFDVDKSASNHNNHDLTRAIHVFRAIYGLLIANMRSSTSPRVRHPS